MKLNRQVLTTDAFETIKDSFVKVDQQEFNRILRESKGDADFRKKLRELTKRTIEANKKNLYN